MIYISYRLKDKAPYTSLCLALEYEGLPYWKQNLKSGVSLKDQLQEALSKCDVCIFIATPDSVKAPWCMNEVGAFWGAGRRIIVFAAHAGIEDKLPPLFIGDYWISDAREVMRQAREALAEPEKQATSKSASVVTRNTASRGVDYFDRANRSSTTYPVLQELAEHLKGLEELAYTPGHKGESANSLLSEIENINDQIGGLWRLSQDEWASHALLKEIGRRIDVLQRKLKADEELKPYKGKLLALMSADERLLHLVLEAFGGRTGVLRKGNSTLKRVFEDNEGEEIGEVEGALANAGYRTELAPDEVHGLWEIETVAAGGTKVKIDWDLASQSEFQGAF